MTKTYIPSHVYFAVTNQAAEKERFLESDTYEPHFMYGQILDEELIGRRLESVSANTGDVRKQMLELARIGATLQSEQSDELLGKFRAINAILFDQPRRDYVEAILSQVQQHVQPNTQILWGDIVQRLGGSFEEVLTFEPPKEVFLQYRHYLLEYLGNKVVSGKGNSPFEVLQEIGQKIDLKSRGWKIVGRNDASHGRVNQKTKTIYIGRQYEARNPGAAHRIAIHEIYGHALRGPQVSIQESEGFAIVLEQLMNSHFIMRRAYRYLAAGLGWGVMGTPMTFREVFDIVWRTMVIVSGYDEERAKSYAFDECTRVFRGGRPEIAGAVYLKDTAYFSGNIAMWDTLVKQPLSYNEFVDVIEGRRRVLV